MVKRILSVLLAAIMIFTLLPTFSFASTTDEVSRMTVSVYSAEELEAALNLGTDMKIIIKKDFALDRTFYVTSDVIIMSKSARTLTRSEYFVGDIFVVGEDSDHNNPVLDGKDAVLTLGNPDSDKENLLVIDGNRDGMLAGLKVSGTVIFIVNSAKVNIYSNTSVVNCKKEDNLRLLEYDYPISNPTKVGGAAAIVLAGSLNIYGGNISNNACIGEDEISTDVNDADYRLSSQGGAVYNYGNVNVYGGTFENNQSSRGAAIYNYKKTRIFGGSFINNSAERYGGAIYCPNSQYSNLIMGYADGTDEDTANTILFNGNSATSSGGAIFAQTKSGIVIYENADVTFEENYTEAYNGGAICTSGALTVKGGTKFVRNSSACKGGALYLYKSLEDKKVRVVSIECAEFIENTAARGGAIALSAKQDTYSEGGIAHLKNCTFTGNNAETKFPTSKTVADSTTNGGAVYISRKSTMTVESCTFTGNSTELKEGGGIYITGQSTVTVTGSVFDSNRAGSIADGCGGAIATHGSVVKITDTEFKNNISDRHGAALYCSYKNLSEGQYDHARVLLEGCDFTANKSGYHGGGIYVTSREDTAYDDATFVQITDCNFTENYAETNGGGVYLTKSVAYLKDCSFTENRAHAVDSTNTARYGGAGVYLSSGKITVSEVSFENNSSDYNGGALEAHTGSTVITDKVTATGNTSANHGGAFYINKSTWTDYDGVYSGNHAGTYGGGLAIFTYSTAKLYNTVSENNVADLKGGGIFCFGGSDSYMENVTVQNNAANGTDTSCGGGGIYITGTVTGDTGSTVVGSNAEFNGCKIISNTANKGGAIAAFSDSHFVFNNCSVQSNTADYRGGAIYSSSGNFEAFDTVFEANTSTDYGGAIAVPSNAVQCLIDGCRFVNNTAGTGAVEGNGGAIWWYSQSVPASEFSQGEEALCVVSNTEFTGNEASKYGGAVAVQNGSHVQAFNVTATDNKCVGNGGFMYIATSGSQVEIDGLTVSGNTAGSGNAVYTYQEPKLTVNASAVLGDNAEKGIASPDWEISSFTDSATENTHKTDYTASQETETYSEPVTYFSETQVSEEEAELIYTPEEESSVDVIFELGEGTPANSKISTTYSKLKKDTNPYNFHGKSQTVFEDINGKDVTVESFVLQINDANNNTIYPIGIMIYQAMLYKRSHPEENVQIHFSTFRLCEEVAVNINPDSKYYGYMRNLTGKEYDRNGFVRISYLMVEAAKMGIELTVIGQTQGVPVSTESDGFVAYFEGHMNDACDSTYISDETKTVGDYLKFYKCNWTAYTLTSSDGDLPATDMMHTKICAVSNYTDYNGVDHGPAVWFGSSNLDGVQSSAISGRNKIQTASVVSDHDEMYRVSVNYLNLIAQYCNQEDIKDFREVVVTRNETQIETLLAGGTVPADEQIVYTGTENDSVFELYFTPLGGDVNEWNTELNPYAKYAENLLNSDDYILFALNNVKYSSGSYSFACTFESVINKAFTSNPNSNNRAFIMARDVKADGTVAAFNGDDILSLKVGEEIGYASVNKKLFSSIHNKDMLFSYSLNGKREYVSVISSINFHLGASYYQSNLILVIKETDGTDENSVFYNIAKYTTNGIVENNITKATFSLSKTAFLYNGKSQTPTVSASISTDDYEVIYPEDTVSVGKHTVTIKGKGIGTGTKTLTYTIKPKGTSLKTLTANNNTVTAVWTAQKTKMNTSFITGYELQYSTSEKFTTATTVAVTGYSTVSTTIPDLTGGTAYYVRIRTYMTVSGKKYASPWSASMTVST